MIRRLLRRAYISKLMKAVKHLPGFDLSAPAIIFAPHPDDETLGCGGAIALKRRAGTDVTIAYMTDGRHSHSRIMDERQLAQIRITESRAAASILGVPKESVVHWSIPDRSLGSSSAEAIQRCEKLLHETSAREVFVPYRHDGKPDHEAANLIVRSALGSCESRPQVFEYPVWAWHHWPLVAVPRVGLKLSLEVWMKDLRRAPRFLNTFCTGIDISKVIDTKYQALSEHKSQMSRLMDTPNWKTLADISQGDFLQCFFLGYEFFHVVGT